MADQANSSDLLFSPDEIQKLSNRPLNRADAEAMAKSASDAVRDYCGWRVAASAQEVFTLTARSKRLLMLPSLHITEIENVIENGIPIEEGVHFDWDEYGMLERIDGAWSTRRRAIKVSVKHGLASCPAAIGQAITSAVARGTLSPVGNVVGETTLGASVTYGRGPGGTAAGLMFMPHELETFDRYRIGQSR